MQACILALEKLNLTNISGKKYLLAFHDNFSPMHSYDCPMKACGYPTTSYGFLMMIMVVRIVKFLLLK